MKSKPNALSCPEAQQKIYPFRARPPLTQGRQEAKYCTPLGDLSFSTDQYGLIFIRASEQLPRLTTSTSFFALLFCSFPSLLLVYPHMLNWDPSTMKRGRDPGLPLTPSCLTLSLSLYPSIFFSFSISQTHACTHTRTHTHTHTHTHKHTNRMPWRYNSAKGRLPLL